MKNRNYTTLLISVALGIAIGLAAVFFIHRSASSGDRVLHLSYGDVTESHLRTETRGYILKGTITETNCRAMKDLSPDEVIAMFDSTDTEYNGPRSDPNDRRRAAQIIQQECDRVYK